MKKVAIVLFSIWVWLISFITMIVGSTLALILTPIAPFRKTHNYLGGPSMAACVRYTLSKIEVIYDPDYDPEKRSVYLQNHISLLDGHIACLVIPHSFCGLHMAHHFKIPGYGWIMKLAKGIPVYPSKSGRTAEISAAAQDRINLGISILAFPEGHRTLDGKIREFKRGVFFMTRDAGVPFVPLMVRGMYDVNRKGDWKMYPFKKVTFYVGRQYEIDPNLDEEGIRQLAMEWQARFDAFVERKEFPEDSKLSQKAA